MTSADLLEAQRRIQVDFVEWPMLKLTFPQARRLWNLPLDVCEAAMANLVQADFLLYRNGLYLRRGLGLGRRRAGVRQPNTSPRRAA
jgi:hypothetical protein